jgi:hypothetical protein
MNYARGLPRLSRRQFMQGAGLIGLGLLAGCGRWPGQAPPSVPKVARIGVLASEPIEEAGYELLRQALRDLGYIEGQNLVLEPRFPAEREAMSSVAADLVRLPVDVIVTGGITATLAYHWPPVLYPDRDTELHMTPGTLAAHALIYTVAIPRRRALTRTTGHARIATDGLLCHNVPTVVHYGGQHGRTVGASGDCQSCLC